MASVPNAVSRIENEMPPQILARFRPLGLNSRQFTESDFFNVCERGPVLFKEIAEPFSWWMVLEDERNCIVLNSRLRGYERLFTMFHELGHYLMHGGRPLAGDGSAAFTSREEMEADAFATYALYPQSLLVSGELREYESHDTFLRSIRRRRERLFSLYGE